MILPDMFMKYCLYPSSIINKMKISATESCLLKTKLENNKMVK